MNDNSVRSCLPQRQTVLLCLGQMNLIDGVLSAFLIGLVVQFLGFDRSPWTSSSISSHQGSSGHSLSPCSAFFATCDEYCIQD